MRLSLINPYYHEASERALEEPGRYRHVEVLATALTGRGHKVTVIQAFFDDRAEDREGVRYRYVRTPQRPVYRLAGGTLGVDLLDCRNLAAILDALPEAKPEGVHMNGLTLVQPLAAIGRWCAIDGLPLTVSHHGGSPRRIPWLRSAHRRAVALCRGVFFTTETHAKPWIAAGILRKSQVLTCMEVSSTFSPLDRSTSRSRTGMRGSPVFVWNARLHRDKDPLTALKGFGLIRAQLPDARLYMIYLSAEMLPEVRETIDALRLTDAVEMKGRIPHDDVQDFLNSADFIIQSSLREVAGLSIVEAMACGVIPIVADIPSFQAMTDCGRHGILFPPGDFQLLAERVLALDPRNLQALSNEVRAHFVRSLSYDAIAEAYERALEGRA